MSSLQERSFRLLPDEPSEFARGYTLTPHVSGPGSRGLMRPKEEV